MITFSVNQDGNTKQFVLRAELENAITGIVNEQGSPFSHPIDLFGKFLADNAYYQWLLRYPPAAITAAFVDLTAKRSAVSLMENSAEIEAAQAAADTAQAACDDAIYAIVGNPTV